jgi:vancomycin permeability regulator SanA
MRYLIAMVFATVGAAGATVFISARVASWVVARHTFDSPDEVATLHALVFMAVNVLGLAIGWSIGWWLGRGFGADQSQV